MLDRDHELSLDVFLCYIVVLSGSCTTDNSNTVVMCSKLFSEYENRQTDEMAAPVSVTEEVTMVVMVNGDDDFDDN